MKKKDEFKKRREEKIKKEFGLHLINLRQSRNLSLRELAAIADIDHSSISKSENGTRNTPFQDLIALAEALNIDFSDLNPYK